MRIETPFEVTGDGRYIFTASLVPQSLSGGLDLTGTLFLPSIVSSHIASTNSDLILSASTSQVTVSGVLFATNKVQSAGNVEVGAGSNLFWAGSVATAIGSNNTGKLTFTSNVGVGTPNIVVDLNTPSTWTFSGSVRITGALDFDKSVPYHINSNGSDLILSSSATSNVFVSSSLHVMGTNKAANYNDKIFIVGSGSTTGTDFLSITGDGRIFLGTDNGTNSVVNVNNFGSQDKGLFSFKDYATNPNPLGVIIGTSDPSYNVGIAYGVNGSNVYLGNTAVYTAMLVVSGSTGDVALNYQNSILYHFKSNLVLSSSAGSIVAVSSSLDFPNKDKSYHVRAVNSDLIFSSSTSKVTISGNLQTPVGQVILSGSNGNAAANLALTFTDTPTLGISNAFGRFTVNVGGATRFEVTPSDVRCDVSNIYCTNFIASPGNGSFVWGNTSNPTQGPIIQAPLDGRINISGSSGQSVLCLGAITGSLGDSIIYSALGSLILSSSTSNIFVSGSVIIGGSGSISGTGRFFSTMGSGSIPAFIFDTSGSGMFSAQNQHIYSWKVAGTELFFIDGTNEFATTNGNFVAQNATPSAGNGAFIGQGMRRQNPAAGFQFAWGESIAGNTTPGVDLFPIGGTMISGGILFRLSADNALNNVALLVNGSGNLGIGITNPLTKLHISGGFLMTGFTSASLPSTLPTGTLAYVSDLGFMAIYTGNVSKWMRIASSSF